MAKKIVTPEEYKAKLEKRAAKRKKFMEIFLKTLAFGLAIAMVYSATTIAHTRIAVLENGGAVTTGGTSIGGTSTSGGSSTGGTSTGGTTAGGSTSGDSTGGSTGGSTNNDATTPDAPASAEDQEALDMYKTGVTNARTKSTKVIRVKDGAINYKKHVKAGGLTDVASSLMGMFMAENEDAIEVKNEEWDKTQLPNPSALTLNGIKKITREDKGNTYVITIVAKDQKNPKAGADGVGAVAGVIEESQITGAIGSVPGLKLSNINIAYENVTAVATIDKATGNCIALNLNAPCILGLDAKLAVISVDGAEVGIQVITEYAISY